MRMLGKEHRLTGKQIGFLLWRGRKYYGRFFVLIAFPQRQAFSRSQWSINIPVKVDKRATMRNVLKRQAKKIFSSLLEEITLPWHWQMFLFVNKKTLEDIKQLIASGDKTTIVPKRKEWCVEDFHFFLQKLWIDGWWTWWKPWKPWKHG